MGRLTDKERFWPKVNKTDTCWLWQGALYRSGYGAFRYDGQMRVAHRFAYQVTVGAVPDGRVLDHLCRVRACVRPDHLEPVTDRENVLRGVGPTADNASKTHCDGGHELTEQNTYVSPPTKAHPRGCRHCRICKAEALRAHRARKAATL
jgi:hypothetical protein